MPTADLLTRLRVTLEQRRAFDAAITRVTPTADGMGQIEVAAMQSVVGDLDREAAALHARITGTRRCTEGALLAAAYYAGASSARVELHERWRLTVAVKLPPGTWDRQLVLNQIRHAVDDSVAADIGWDVIEDVGEDALRACAGCSSPFADLGDVPNVGRCPDCCNHTHVGALIAEWLADVAAQGELYPTTVLFTATIGTEEPNPS